MPLLAARALVILDRGVSDQIIDITVHFGIFKDPTLRSVTRPLPQVCELLG